MPYLVTAPLVLAKDREGKVRYHYRGNVPAPANSGPIIPWLSDEQAAHFLRLGVVERIEEEKPVDISKIDSEALQDCLKALERLGVDLSAGAPTARAALGDAGLRFGNDVVASAIKARKEALLALSGTAP
jgi:hypothetical protein